MRSPPDQMACFFSPAPRWLLGSRTVVLLALLCLHRRHRTSQHGAATGLIGSRRRRRVCLAAVLMEFGSTGASSAPPTRECSSVIASAVQRGDLWNARRRALAHCLRPPETDVQAPSFLTATRSAPPAPPSFDDGCGRQCASAWASAVEELSAQPGHLQRIRRTHRRHFRRLGGLWVARLADCFAGGARAEGWEACCSTLRPLEQQSGHCPYATQGSNPRLADPRQVCYSHA